LSDDERLDATKALQRIAKALETLAKTVHVGTVSGKRYIAVIDLDRR
jgi:hypothetical protein